MSMKIHEYVCRSCGSKQEQMTDSANIPETIACTCRVPSEATPGYFDWGVMYKVISAPAVHAINKKNGDYVNRTREQLEKRANDHFKKEGLEQAREQERKVLKKFQGGS